MTTMTTMNCDKQNRIHVRNRREQKIIIRCADMASPYFTREVTSEQCEQCPRKKVVEVPEPVNPPSAVRRAATYVKAVAGWVAKGAPERTDEEVQKIFQICEDCKWYKNQHCQKCGCKVRQSGVAMLNKIKMATEHCPIGSW